PSHIQSGEITMPTYIMLVNFTDQGLRGVKEIPNRQEKSREIAKQFGVERKTVWMTFGPYDFVHLYDAPNDEAMAKFVMTLTSFGNLRTTVMRALPIRACMIAATARAVSRQLRI